MPGKRRKALPLRYSRHPKGYVVQLGKRRTLGLLVLDGHVWKWEPVKDVPSFRVHKTKLAEAKREIERKLRLHDKGLELSELDPLINGPLSLVDNAYLRKLLR